MPVASWTGSPGAGPRDSSGSSSHPYTGPEDASMRTDRRQFLRDGVWGMSALVGSPSLLAAAREERARPLPAGVHLFLDSELVAEERNLRRVIHPPTRLPEPIVTATEDRCFQPYVSVIRDPRTKRIRMWYNAAVDATRSNTG